MAVRSAPRHGGVIVKTREALKEAIKGKVNKSDADYRMDSSYRYARCGRCEYFLPAKVDDDDREYDGRAKEINDKALGECKLVWGNIDPQAWCKYFEPRADKANKLIPALPS